MFTRTVVILGLLFSASATSAESTPAEDLKAIETDWNAAWEGYQRAYADAETAAERQLLKSKLPDYAAFAERYLKLADAHPGTNEELIALCWAGLNASKSDAGKAATARLTKGGRIDQATPKELYAAISDARRGRSEAGLPIVPAVLARAKKSLDDPDTAHLLAWVCVQYMDDNSDQAPVPFAEAADLIVAKFADSPDISHFCEALFLRNPRWAAEFEKHLAVIVEKNKSPLVSLSSRFALASVVYNQGIKGQERAETLFRQFVTEFDGDGVSEEVHSIRDFYLGEAREAIKQIERRGLGKPAPEIAGVDLDGNPLKLSDHKGKVVLLVFWASWCGPCLADVPHEKELVEKFKGRPFVLLGVNGDTNKDEANRAIKRAGIPWQSFWDGPDNPNKTADAWAVSGWPTVIVIDHTGVIRESRLRGKRLDAPLETYVAEAEKASKR